MLVLLISGLFLCLQIPNFATRVCLSSLSAWLSFLFRWVWRQVFIKEPVSLLWLSNTILMWTKQLILLASFRCLLPLHLQGLLPSLFLSIMHLGEFLMSLLLFHEFPLLNHLHLLLQSWSLLDNFFRRDYVFLMVLTGCFIGFDTLLLLIFWRWLIDLLVTRLVLVGFWPRSFFFTFF